MNKGYKKWGQKLDLTSNYGSWPKSFTIYERQLIKTSSVLKMATERKRQSQFAGGNVNLPARPPYAHSYYTIANLPLGTWRLLKAKQE